MPRIILALRKSLGKAAGNGCWKWLGKCLGGTWEWALGNGLGNDAVFFS